MYRKIMLRMLSIALISVCFFAPGCSEWTEPEAANFYPQDPAVGTSHSYSEMYYENLRTYRKSPHKLFVGWFGGWSGYGNGVPGQGALVRLPDSIDMVCLWLFTGNGNPIENFHRDADEFHRRGSKTVMCWSARNIGDGVTPQEWKGREDELYGSSWEEAIPKYAQAIVDTCVRYHIDGFENDMEGSGPLIQNKEQTNLFLRELIKRFRIAHEEHPDDCAGIVTIDIPIWSSYVNQFYPILENDVLEDLYLIQWQSYTELDRSMSSYFTNIHDQNPEMFETVMKKSIITATFERGDTDKNRLKTGILYGHKYYGVEPAGYGAYHIEYDFSNNSYAYVRECLGLANPSVTE